MRYPHFEMLPEEGFQHCGNGKIQLYKGGFLGDVVDSVGNAFESLGSGISDALSGLDDWVREEIPGGWLLPAAAVAAVATGGGSLAALGESGAVEGGAAAAGGVGGVAGATASSIAGGTLTAAQAAELAGLGASSITSTVGAANLTAAAASGAYGSTVASLVAAGMPASMAMALPSVSTLASNAAVNAAMQMATTGKVDVGSLVKSLAMGSVSSVAGAGVSSAVGSLGIDNPLLASIANSAAQGATGAALSGRNPVTAALSSALAGGVGYATQGSGLPQTAVNTTINALASGQSVQNALISAAIATGSSAAKDQIKGFFQDIGAAQGKTADEVGTAFENMCTAKTEENKFITDNQEEFTKDQATIDGNKDKIDAFQELRDEYDTKIASYEKNKDIATNAAAYDAELQRQGYSMQDYGDGFYAYSSDTPTQDSFIAAANADVREANAIGEQLNTAYTGDAVDVSPLQNAVTEKEQAYQNKLDAAESLDSINAAKADLDEAKTNLATATKTNDIIGKYGVADVFAANKRITDNLALYKDLSTATTTALTTLNGFVPPEKLSETIQTEINYQTNSANPIVVTSNDGTTTATNPVTNETTVLSTDNIPTTTTALDATLSNPSTNSSNTIIVDNGDNTSSVVNLNTGSVDSVINNATGQDVTSSNLTTSGLDVTSAVSQPTQPSVSDIAVNQPVSGLDSAAVVSQPTQPSVADSTAVINQPTSGFDTATNVAQTGSTLDQVANGEVTQGTTDQVAANTITGPVADASSPSGYYASGSNVPVNADGSIYSGLSATGGGTNVAAVDTGTTTDTGNPLFGSVSSAVYKSLQSAKDALGNQNLDIDPNTGEIFDTETLNIVGIIDPTANVSPSDGIPASTGDGGLTQGTSSGGTSTGDGSGLPTGTPTATNVSGLPTTPAESSGATPAQLPPTTPVDTAPISQDQVDPYANYSPVTTAVTPSVTTTAGTTGGGLPSSITPTGAANTAKPDTTTTDPNLKLYNPAYLQSNVIKGSASDALPLFQGLDPKLAKLIGFAHGGEVHPQLQRVLSSRGYEMNPVEMVAGPEDRYYARHAKRGFAVNGPGTGQSDDIPTMLADGEYVFDADTVAALGDGSSKAGAQALDKMREEIRKHKRSAPVDKIPPKAKSPLDYLKMVRKGK